MGPDCHPWASTPRGSGSTGLGMTALHEPPHLVECAHVPTSGTQTSCSAHERHEGDRDRD